MGFCCLFELSLIGHGWIVTKDGIFNGMIVAKDEIFDGILYLGIKHPCIICVSIEARGQVLESAKS